MVQLLSGTVLPSNILQLVAERNEVKVVAFSSSAVLDTFTALNSKIFEQVSSIDYSWE